MAENAERDTEQAAPTQARSPKLRSYRPIISEAEEIRRARMPKTTGEWVYDNIQFWFVKGLILGATGVIGYYAKFGKETNFIRKFQNWCVKTIAEPLEHAGGKAGASIKQSMPSKFGQWLGDKTHEVMAVFGGAFASTMVLFHGGNVVAPIVQWFENHRQEIVNGANRRWGKPGEMEKGDEKFAYTPRQTFGDVVVGRLTAWMTVFASFFTVFLGFGKMKNLDNPKMYRLDYFEEKMSRAITGLDKTFAHIPMNHQLSDIAKKTPEMFKGNEKRLFGYKAARILVLDFFATTAGIIVWTLSSRQSSRARLYGESFFTSLKHSIFPKTASSDNFDAAPVAAPVELDTKSERSTSHGENVRRRQTETVSAQPSI